ncbi:Ctr copper transporter family-domain-containing protein [Apiospora arundinis]|uniref:Copper transport protein n=1 Tax=Apiospora arundinis TaxID=335852 RepID=A0ABR2JA12_9PEZI
MDHSHMDHGGMDHGDMGHGGGSAMPEMCNMNMLFTWDTNNLCIVFKQWHVRGNISLMFSLLAVVLFCVGYEWLRGFIRKYETEAAQKAEAVPTGEPVTESTPFLGSTTEHRQVNIEKRSHAVKTALYAIQTFYAYMLMLLFMTYNGFVMLAVAVGAGLGYYFFGQSTSAAKETACH